MKLIKTLVGTSLVLALHSNAWAEYSYCTNENEAYMPDRSKIEIPNGAEASMDDMLAAQNAIKEFNKKAEAHIQCLDTESKAAGEDLSEAENALIIERHNNAVNEMQKLADTFNLEVCKFKAAQDGKSWDHCTEKNKKADDAKAAESE